MIRSIAASLFFSLILGLSAGIPANVAHAQVCNPECGAGKICAYDGVHYTGVCIASQTTTEELVVTAAPKASGKTLRTFVDDVVIPLGNGIIALLFACAFFLFIFGVFKYFFLKGTDPKSREEGRLFMIWGIIGLAVMFSVWGLVHLVITIIPT